MTEQISIDIEGQRRIKALYNRPDGESGDVARDKTLVLMIHDFPGDKGGHKDLFGDLESLLGERGLHTLRFDFRGCGESDGRRQDFTMGAAGEDLQNVLYWARDRGYKYFIYIGEGLGAALGIMYVDIDVKATILLWPALDLKTLARHFLAEAGDKGTEAGRFLITELQKTRLDYALKQISMPTLILHGGRDAVMPVETLDIARAKIPARRIEITIFHDGGHGLAQPAHRKTVFYHITQFIAKYA